MKKMKRIASLLLAMVMVFAMSVTAFADETYTITVNGEEGYTYEVYQIFAGDLFVEESGEKILSNIVWGTGVSAAGQTALGDAAAKAATITDTAKAEAFADEVAPYLEDGTVMTATGATYTAAVEEAGYYLIKNTNVPATGAYTDYILKVVEDVNVTPKAVYPTVDKQVLDEVDDAEEGAVNGWGETADHELNETFQFKLIANLPANEAFDDYKTYKLVFTDTMSAGVTFEKIESVTVDGVKLEEGQYTCTAKNGDAGTTWTLTITDAKAIAGVNLTDGAVVEVIYNAHLNANAEIGNKDENKNTVKLQYSNNPNWDGTGEEELGETEEDTVWVFTYEVNAVKVDGATVSTEEGATPDKLAGAEFKLYNAEGKYAKLDGNGKLSAWVTEEEATVITSGEDGTFKVAGLDAGTYYLKETKAPAGYNLLTTPITVVITAVHAEDASETTATTEIKVNDVVNGTITVENNKGTELPETGGIGTTIFYLIGGTFVIAAAVLLVTRRRMNHEA